MFKSSIRFPLIYFAVLTLYQLIINKEIRWIENIGVSLVTFLIMILYNWSKVPYKWKNKRDNE